MADKSKIEWTEATWNPVTGCTKVSPGCDHCYAERIVERFHGKGSFTDVQIHEDRLAMPSRWKRPRRVFVNSMSDLFHHDVPDLHIAQVFAAMAKSPQHTFQVLTKRHARMRSLLSGDLYDLMAAALTVHDGVREQTPRGLTWPLPNVWLGVSVENQHWADIRVPALLDTPAAVRWLSCEPLLGAVDLMGFFAVGRLPGIDWVVAGGESGSGARPMHPDWPRKLRDQCAEWGVPFFFKQHGEYVLPEFIDTAGWDDRSWDEAGVTIWPDGRKAAGFAYGTVLDGSELLWRVGKKRAGRVLDGRTHDEYPALVA